MTHDAEEAEEHEGDAEEHHTLLYARHLVGTLLLDGSGSESGYGKEADSGKDGEDTSPAEAESRHHGCRAPGHEIGGEKGSESLHKLSEGKRRGQTRRIDEARHKGIERCLHHCVAYA